MLCLIDVYILERRIVSHSLKQQGYNIGFFSFNIDIDLGKIKEDIYPRKILEFTTHDILAMTAAIDHHHYYHHRIMFSFLCSVCSVGDGDAQHKKIRIQIEL